MTIVPLETDIKGLILIHSRIFTDDRGWFSEGYRRSAFHELGIQDDFSQDNLSWSRRNVIRGLHFQRVPHAQAKLVRVLQGEVLDVAVDLRPQSSTYLRVFTCRLSAAEGLMLYVPTGFAHGFRALEDSLFSYKCSSEYRPESDGGVRWDDPTLCVDWGMKPGEPAFLSDKDRALPSVQEWIGRQST